MFRREMMRLRDPIRLGLLLALWLGPFVLSIFVLRSEIDRFSALDPISQQIALDSGAIRGWVNILFALYAFALPLASAFLTTDSLSTEFVDGTALVWRTWPLRNRDIALAKYAAVWLAIVPPFLGLFATYAAVVQSWAPDFDQSSAVSNFRSLLFLGSYYLLLGFAISAMAPLPSLSAVGTIFAGYDWLIVPIMLGPNGSRGFYFEHYWGILQTGWLGTDSIPASETGKAALVVGSVIILLLVAVGVGIARRDPR